MDIQRGRTAWIIQPIDFYGHIHVHKIHGCGIRKGIAPKGCTGSK
jgi:hypothetical protein